MIDVGVPLSLGGITFGLLVLSVYKKAACANPQGETREASFLMASASVSAPRSCLEFPP